MTEASARPSAFVLYLGAVCLGLGVTVVALVRRNAALTARVEDLSGRVLAAEADREASLVGAKLPVTTLFATDGEPVDLTAIPEDHGSLLLVSSPGCDYCQLAAPVWEAVARDLGGTRLRVLGLVLQPDPASGAAAPTPAYPSLRAGDADAELQGWLPGVPAALLLDAHGRVVHAELGGRQAGLEGAVQSFLGSP